MTTKDLISELITIFATRRIRGEVRDLLQKLASFSEDLTPEVEKAAAVYMSKADQAILTGKITLDEILGICLNMLTLVHGLMTDEGQRLFSEFLNKEQ